MNNNRKILSIAIPTYNRVKKLEKSITRIINFCADKEVEIIVSDNASNDGTKQAVERLQKLYPQIQYYRNERNLGFDGNFLNCFEKATGKYVWLIGDDDVVLNGSIESILSCLELHPICVHLNSSALIDEERMIISKPRFKVEGNIIIEDRNIFLEKIGIYCTFVSSLIFNGDLVHNVKNKERYFNTNILQSHVFLETMSEDGIYVINTYNSLAATNNKVVSYDVLRTWIKNYSDLLLDTAVNVGFASETVSRVLRNDLNDTIYKFIINFRQTCCNEGDWDRKCIWKYINMYPELVKKYEIAVYCPVKYLKYLSIFEKVKSKFHRKIDHGE